MTCPLQALLEARNIQQLTSGTCAILMDVNIFWRTLKVLYCTTYVEHNTRGALHDFLPVLGVWHAYAHSVKKVYDHFLPWWAALEVLGFLRYPEESTVYTKPKLVTVEHLVMGVFLAAPRLEADIRRTLLFVQERYGPESVQAQQAEGVLILCTEYVPALVEMGIAVRQCFWEMQEGNTGEVARDVLRDAIVLLSGIAGAATTEYLRNLCLMELLWSPMHSALPAAAFVEECLESSLSVLARRKASDPRATTVKDFSDMYSQGPEYSGACCIPPIYDQNIRFFSGWLIRIGLTCSEFLKIWTLTLDSAAASIGKANQHPKDLTKPGISRMFPWTIGLRLTEMLQAIGRGGIPGVVRTEGVKTRGCLTWEGAGEVRRLVTGISADTYRRHVYHGLGTLVAVAKTQLRSQQAEGVPGELMRLTRHAPRLTDGYVAQQRAEAADLVSKCKRMAKGDPRRREPIGARAVDEASGSPGERPVMGPPSPPSRGSPGTGRWIPPPPSETAPSSSQTSSLTAVTGRSSSGSLSEHDSRDVETDDDWDGTSAASTDPYGFSPVVTGLEEEDDVVEGTQGAVASTPEDDSGTQGA